MFALITLKIHTVLIDKIFSSPLSVISNNYFGFSFFNSKDESTNIFYITFKYITLTIFLAGIAYFCYLVYKAYKENKKHKNFYETHHVGITPEDIQRYRHKTDQSNIR